MGDCLERASGEELVAVAGVLAVGIARGRSVEQLALLSLFFTALADNLGLYAAQLPQTTDTAQNKAAETEQ